MYFSPVKSIVAFALIAITIFSCKKDQVPDDQDPTPTGPYSTVENTLGYNLLDKVKGIWNGPVTSTTALGSFPEWIVDFRPISASQISAKNELDTMNDIHMSFFIAKYNNEYRVAFRNGGAFGGQTRVSYLLADSVSETASQSYYRFSEILKGKNRCYAEVIVKQDSLIIKSYTNHYDTQPTATPHMIWSAKLQDQTTCAAAVSQFSFPQKTLSFDLSESFMGLTESIFYSITGGDPYPETDQPYLGKANITYSYAGAYSPVSSKKVMLIVSAQPLISGTGLNTNNLKFRSRYVVLSASDLNFTFNYLHPGTYYLYAFYDNDGNGTANSGDWISATNTTFSLTSQQTVSANTQINFTIP
jgi:hypothetical protein